MKVMIKEKGKYFSMDVQDVLQGVEITEVAAEELVIPLHAGITKVKKVNGGYIVTVREKNINRRLTVASLHTIVTRIGGGLTRMASNEVINRLTRMMILWTTDNELQYTTRKGVVLQFQIRESSAGYKLEKDGSRMGRDEGEFGVEKSKLIYPNVFPATKMCWGSTHLPVLKDLSDVGKVAATFFASDSNLDLSTNTIQATRWVGMLHELAGMHDRVDAKYRAAVSDAVDGLRYTNWGTGGQTISNYLVVMLANIYKVDMDWMQDRLYGN